MSLRIVTADERLARKPKVNIALFGQAGVGKTFQAGTLDPETTLFLDLEAGTLALQGWRGDVVEIRRAAADLGVHPWEYCRALACLLCGPDPAASERDEESKVYSAAMFQQYASAIADPGVFAKYQTIFVDSITVAGRLSFQWSQRQPSAFSEKSGKPDTRGAYGLHGREMIRWLTTLQHIPEKSVVVVGILDSETDDFKQVSYSPQIEGAKTGRELPGIFDQVITMTRFSTGESGVVFDPKGGQHRGLVCQEMNPWGLPAKDRSGCLDVVEPPDLGALMRKITAGQRRDTAPIFTGPPAAVA